MARWCAIRKMRWGGGGLSQLCTLAAHPLIRELISGLDPTLWGSQSSSGEQQLFSLFYINIDTALTHPLIRKLIVLSSFFKRQNLFCRYTVSICLPWFSMIHLTKNASHQYGCFASMNVTRWLIQPRRQFKLPWISICLPMIPCKGPAIDALTRGLALTKDKNLLYRC